MIDDQERLKLLALVHGLDTRLARIERLFEGLAAALPGRRAKPRRPSPRKLARELAYANPAVGQVYRYHKRGDVGPCYRVAELDAAGLRLRLVPGLWDPRQQALAPVAAALGAARWVEFASLRGSYEYVGWDRAATLAAAPEVTS